MTPIMQYLNDCRARKSTGAVTPETSLYNPIEILLNAAAVGLNTSVRCFMNLKNIDSNMPDGGVFTSDQFDPADPDRPASLQPAHGVIECKKPTDEVLAIAETEQVSRYWQQFNQVLVTNYREFLLLGRDDRGGVVRLEHFKLVDTVTQFWNKPSAKVEAEQGDACIDFLRRCLLRPAPVTQPRVLAWFLASYAREARRRLEAAGRIEQMVYIKESVEEALGVTFVEGSSRGDQFFRSTLVQTLFYGVFSAWVLWHKDGAGERDQFEWRRAVDYLAVPIINQLFNDATQRTLLNSTHLLELLDWATQVLNRTDRVAFFESFDAQSALQYFYEPFLEQFDPALRKEMGVWYTPREIVRYMVRRVDAILQNEFNIPLGIADPNVLILDPCCGTGAYLVEVLELLAERLEDDATRSAKLKKFVQTNLIGFELLPASLVIAHLQVQLFLQQHDASFELGDKQPQIFMTNALTGWEDVRPTSQRMSPILEAERIDAWRVKTKQPILVVMGNPPYNGYAGLESRDEAEAKLLDDYRTKTAKNEGKKQKGQGLNDLYARFFRIAERCILNEWNAVEHTDDKKRRKSKKAQGIISFISNYSWLDGKSFPKMRNRYLNNFDAVWIDNLNGDSRKTGKLTPTGASDPSAFSTAQNREGIQVGTAITTMVRLPTHEAPAEIHYQDFWGRNKLKELLAWGQHWSVERYQTVEPIAALGYPFRPMTLQANFSSWHLLPDVFPTSYPGVQTSRDQALVEIDHDKLVERMAAYFDTNISDAEMTQLCPTLMKDASRFHAGPTRRTLQARGLLGQNFIPYAYRPFDIRWLYYEPTTKLIDEKRSDYFAHIFPENHWFAAVSQNRKSFDPLPYHPQLICRHIVERGANVFPMLLRTPLNEMPDQRFLIGEHTANISDMAFDYLEQRGGIEATRSLFFHTLAVLHAPSYATENADALRQDWPRVPLPESAELLASSGVLGEELAALLNPETEVPGVTSGRIRAELKPIGVIRKIDNSQLVGTDFGVNARWGIAGKGGICMPSTGKLRKRDYTTAERESVADASGSENLGECTTDIFWNDTCYWANVPAAVWEYSLGGYQVIKKWLSYREERLLGRVLRLEEVEYVTAMIRRIAAILILGGKLNANYVSVKADAFVVG